MATGGNSSPAAACAPPPQMSPSLAEGTLSGTSSCPPPYNPDWSQGHQGASPPCPLPSGPGPHDLGHCIDRPHVSLPQGPEDRVGDPDDLVVGGVGTFCFGECGFLFMLCCCPTRYGKAGSCMGYSLWKLITLIFSVCWVVAIYSRRVDYRQVLSLPLHPSESFSATFGPIEFGGSIFWFWVNVQGFL